MKRIRICIVSPGHLATNPRLVKEAATLSDAGYSVQVICGRFSRWGTEFDAKIAGPSWKVQHVPFGRHEASLKHYLFQTASRTIARKAARLGLAAKTLTEIAHAPIVPGLTAAARKQPADLYIAHYVAALPAVARAAKLNQSHYAFDAEDFHLGDLPNSPEHSFDRSLVKEIEGRYLPGCVYVTASSPLIADAYAETYGVQRPQVVLNSFPLSQAPASPSLEGVLEAGPSVYWFSQTIGGNRGLECAVRAVGLAASRPHLYLRGSVAAGYRERLLRIANELDAAHRIHFLEPAAPSEMERLASTYNLGLASETGESLNRQVCLTNKLFSFILAGLPPLMSDTPAQYMFAAEAGLSDLLYPVGDAVALAGLMDKFLEKPRLLAETRDRVWRLGQERYNWDREHSALLSVVNNVTTKRSLPCGCTTDDNTRLTNGLQKTLGSKHRGVYVEQE